MKSCTSSSSSWTASILWVTFVGVATLATGIATRKYWKKFPYMIAAMLGGGLVAFLINLEFGQAQTGIKTVGALPAGLPPAVAAGLFASPR
jgi:SulP family sulfate permease